MEKLARTLSAFNVFDAGSRGIHILTFRLSVQAGSDEKRLPQEI